MAQDFNPDSYSELRDTRSFPGSGLTAGVESGLGMHEVLTRGTVQPEQMNYGTAFRQEETMTDVAPDSSAQQAGKTQFKFRK